LLSLTLDSLDKKYLISLEYILIICVKLVSFYHVATVLQSIMYIKNLPSILGCVKKKMWKVTLFKRKTPGNVTTSVVQRASTEFRQLLLIISSPRK